MNILIVDDDPLFRANYELMLGEQGHQIRLAANRAQAEAELGKQFFDVVLLDQNLEGSEGGPTGLNLIPAIRSASPGATLIIVSGYWDKTGAIEHAFSLGVDDYLVKGEHLEPLLKAKLLQADRLATARLRAVSSDEKVEQRVREVWSELHDAAKPRAKGKLLEELIAGLLRLAGGFRDVRLNFRNDLEEIDIVALADESSPWARHSLVWIVECKNWSTTVGRAELDALVGKMGRRHGQCSRALMVAWGGVSEPFERGAHVLPQWIVATADREDLARAVTAPDRAAEIMRWFDRAMLNS